jgi:fatty-acid peroxygenase
VTAVHGAEGARFFYEQPYTERASALPMALIGPLFGRGPVHQLDGGAHAHRKSMFNELLDLETSARVTAELTQRWEDRSPQWRGRVEVFDTIGSMLLESVCAWVGIPQHQRESVHTTRDLLALVDGFGAPTARNVRARVARHRTDRWATELVTRSRESAVVGGTPLEIVAHHRDEDGRLLPAHTAAVEVINLIRPLVAVSWLAAGLFEACGTWPALRADIREGRVSPLDVAQEIRRTYPFAPFLATRATQDLTFEGVSIPSGTLIVLDLWGTNHDPRTWDDPDAFDPGRFERTPVTPYNLVPQGGGHRTTGHRCPGEDLTLAVLTTLVPRVAELSFTIDGPRAGTRRMPPKPRLIVDFTAR